MFLVAAEGNARDFLVTELVRAMPQRVDAIVFQMMPQVLKAGDVSAIMLYNIRLTGQATG